MSHTTVIEKVIATSLRELSWIGEENGVQENAKSCLLFPKYRSEKRRVSEQELRFLLARNLEREKIHYSVETPTTEVFKFKGRVPRSALVDLCLHDDAKGRRTHLVELKYKNVNVKQDFEKLLGNSLSGGMNYFVQFVENADNGSRSSIEKKYNAALKSMSKKIVSSVKVFLFVMKKEELYGCEISKGGTISCLRKL